MRPVPFYLGLAFASLGLLLSIFALRDTQAHVRREIDLQRDTTTQPSWAHIFMLTSWKDRALFAASQAGLVNNLNDGVLWGLAPILLSAARLPLEQIAIISATYPSVWGIGQLAAGALSDRWGRKWLIVAGMWIQAAGIGIFVFGQSFGIWMMGSALLGLGTAMVYPTLLAAISDVAQPQWRSSAIGVYRLWRDMGYALGALLGGWLADQIGMPPAIALIGALTFVSGVVVSLAMVETLPARTARPIPQVTPS